MHAPLIYPTWQLTKGCIYRNHRLRTLRHAGSEQEEDEQY